MDIHLTDLLDEMKADGHYRTKVRVHTTSARASSIPKEKLLTAGASKVEIITEETEAADVSASSLLKSSIPIRSGKPTRSFAGKRK